MWLVRTHILPCLREEGKYGIAVANMPLYAIMA